MSVKLIIFNENSGMYKLKNNKNDEGAVVMRRQTWRADGGDKGTCRHIARTWSDEGIHMPPPSLCSFTSFRCLPFVRLET
jgi:hypothetical protein